MSRNGVTCNAFHPRSTEIGQLPLLPGFERDAMAVLPGWRGALQKRVSSIVTVQRVWRSTAENRAMTTMRVDPTGKTLGSFGYGPYCHGRFWA